MRVHIQKLIHKRPGPPLLVLHLSSQAQKLADCDSLTKESAKKLEKDLKSVQELVFREWGYSVKGCECDRVFK